MKISPVLVGFRSYGFGFRSYGFQIWPKYRVFDSDSERVLAKKQMVCSTKCIKTLAVYEVGIVANSS